MDAVSHYGTNILSKMIIILFVINLDLQTNHYFNTNTPKLLLLQEKGEHQLTHPDGQIISL